MAECHPSSTIDWKSNVPDRLFGLHSCLFSYLMFCPSPMVIARICFGKNLKPDIPVPYRDVSESYSLPLDVVHHKTLFALAP